MPGGGEYEYAQNSTGAVDHPYYIKPISYNDPEATKISGIYLTQPEALNACKIYNSSTDIWYLPSRT